MKRFSIAVAFVIGIMCCRAASGETDIYLTGTISTDTSHIWRTTAGSNQLTPLFTIPYNGPRPQMVNSHNGQLYWSSYYPGQLWNSGINGEQPHVLVDQGSTVTRAIQFRENQVYWANEALGAIYRSNLDGSNVQTVISGYTGDSNGIFDFEIYGNRIYWTSWHSGNVKSVNLDGTGFQSYSIDSVTRAFSLEVADNRMFLTDSVLNSGRVVSTNLTGGDLQVLAQNVHDAYSLDVLDGRVYFGNQIQPIQSQIHSVFYDGSDSRLEMNVFGIQLWQIHVVPTPGAMIPIIGGLMGCIRRRRRFQSDLV